jgi:hypothetical protein
VGYRAINSLAYGYVPIAGAEHSNDYEIEVYREIYPVRREPKRALYDPERKKILS